jgi:putative phosphoribosyl transferase
VIFRDRVDAGQHLARALLERFPWLSREDPIVLAIPRGGVVVGHEVARVLGAPLDVFIARKLGAPGHEELGIGAVAPGGARVLDAATIRMLGVPDEYIEEVTQREREELERRLRVFRGDRPPPRIAGRAVVLVDDGLATGVTARAALQALREESPARLIFAAPVCSPEGRDLIAQEGTHVLCVATPERFYGVGAWYADFRQTDDEEVRELLRDAKVRGAIDT